MLAKEIGLLYLLCRTVHLMTGLPAPFVFILVLVLTCTEGRGSTSLRCGIEGGMLVYRLQLRRTEHTN